MQILVDTGVLLRAFDRIVDERVKVIERLGAILTFSLPAYQEWRQLVVRHQITGVSVHDARLVAAMLSSGVTTIVTLNDADFRRYPGIVPLTPEMVVQA